PWAKLQATRTTSWKTSLFPAATLAALKLAVLPLLVSLKLSVPLVWLSESSVVPLGRASVRVTFCESKGPVVVSVMVYVAVVGAVTVAGPLLVMLRSAGVASVLVKVELLL